VKLEGKGGGFGGPGAENGETEAGRGGSDAGEVEAAPGDGKSGSLGAAEAEKEDRELAAEVAEAATSVVAETQATGAEPVKVELGEDGASPASPDAPAGEEQEKPAEGGVVAEVKDGKVADDAESPVSVEEKPEGTKGEVMNSGDGGGSELGGGKEKEEVSASAGVAEATGQEDKVAVGGEEAPEEASEKEGHVEDKAAKPETLNEDSQEVCEHAESNFISD
jgi:hypothetical protein